MLKNLIKWQKIIKRKNKNIIDEFKETYVANKSTPIVQFSGLEVMFLKFGNGMKKWTKKLNIVWIVKINHVV